MPRPPHRQASRDLSSGEATPLATESSQIVREIDDPHLGTRWLLMRDPVHPAARAACHDFPGEGTVQERQTGAPASEVIANRFSRDSCRRPVIVEENSPVVEARLEALRSVQPHSAQRWRFVSRSRPRCSRDCTRTRTRGASTGDRGTAMTAKRAGSMVLCVGWHCSGVLLPGRPRKTISAAGSQTDAARSSTPRLH